MNDSRRNRRPDSRQMWNESDRRDKNPPRDRDRDWDRDHRDRDRDRERGGRDRRGYRSRSRDRRDGPRDRSRSPDRRNWDRDGDRNRGGRNRRGGRDRGRDSPRRYDDRDGRDKRIKQEDGDDRRIKQEDGDDRDRRPKYRDDYRRRSASPNNRSPPPHASALPTRPHPNNNHKKQPNADIPIKRSDSRSPSPPIPSVPPVKREDGATPMDEDNEEEDEMAMMQAMMGFGEFGTTKGKKVIGNNVGAIRKEKKTEYRQYMNRQGGFNRPLSPSR